MFPNWNVVWLLFRHAFDEVCFLKLPPILSELCGLLVLENRNESEQLNWIISHEIPTSSFRMPILFGLMAPNSETLSLNYDQGCVQNVRAGSKRWHDE
jgi:hypothetical protein